jgi:hypothetical protein
MRSSGPNEAFTVAVVEIPSASRIEAFPAQASWAGFRWVFGITGFEYVRRVDRWDRAAAWRGSGPGVDGAGNTCHRRIPADRFGPSLASERTVVASAGSNPAVLKASSFVPNSPRARTGSHVPSDFR